MQYKIAIVGEAWGEHEERARLPFQGPAGYHLTRMLGEAGIDRGDCFLTNVFNLRPPGNRIAELCGPKTDGIPGYRAIDQGKYIRHEFVGELNRLGEELVEVDPNLIIATGNVPLWALSNSAGITKLRGTLLYSTHCASGFKVLPTIHPAAILPNRQPEFRPIIVADLMKAADEQHFPEIVRPSRQIIIEPTLEEVQSYCAECEKSPLIAVDIETSGTQITEIGLAHGPESACVIPFVHRLRPGRSYWPDAGTELEVWMAIRMALERSPPEKVFQNGLYDISVLFRSYGIRVRGATHDTMLLHHALQPEMRKALGFLGSLYTNERAWKNMRSFAVKTRKTEDE